VLFSKGINQILDLKRFVNDPIMPQGISTAVGKFYNTDTREISYKSINTKVHFVRINTGLFEVNRSYKKIDKSDLKRGDAEGYRTFLAFKVCCIKLLSEINTWNSQSNARLNIRNDLNIY
jgi:hypothetical protein